MLRRLGRIGRLGREARRKASVGVPLTPPIDDTQAFLSVARQSFLQMQAAWDRADMKALGLLATEALLEDLREQLAQRPPGPNCTQVLELDARLLGLEDLCEAYVASVEFSGLIREQVDAVAHPFRELWLLADVKSSGRGWKLARVQALS